MIKVQNNTATRTPIPPFLRKLKPESLADLSWTDPALGVQDAAWWPEVDQSPALGEYERYGAETLTVDAENRRVIVVREVVPWTPEEIAEAVDQDRADAKRRMLDWINDFLAPLEAGYSKAEVDAFPAKGPAAENYSAGEARSADMLMLQAEADELGITVAEHVANILPKSRPYTKAVGITSALRQKTFAQIDAAQPADIPGILDAAKTAAMTKAAELGIA